MTPESLARLCPSVMAPPRVTTALPPTALARVGVIQDVGEPRLETAITPPRRALADAPTKADTPLCGRPPRAIRTFLGACPALGRPIVADPRADS